MLIFIFNANGCVKQHALDIITVRLCPGLFKSYFAINSNLRLPSAKTESLRSAVEVTLSPRFLSKSESGLLNKTTMTNVGQYKKTTLLVWSSDCYSDLFHKHQDGNAVQIWFKMDSLEKYKRSKFHHMSIALKINPYEKYKI